MFCQQLVNDDISIILILDSINKIQRFLEARLQDYYYFSNELGVDERELRDIPERFAHDTKYCIRHLFSVWKNKSNDVSHQAIVKALKASGHIYLSTVIEKYYESVHDHKIDLSTFELTHEG